MYIVTSCNLEKSVNKTKLNWIGHAPRDPSHRPSLARSLNHSLDCQWKKKFGMYVGVQVIAGRFPWKNACESIVEITVTTKLRLFSVTVQTRGITSRSFRHTTSENFVVTKSSYVRETNTRTCNISFVSSLSISSPNWRGTIAWRAKRDNTQWAYHHQTFQGVTVRFLKPLPYLRLGRLGGTWRWCRYSSVRLNEEAKICDFPYDLFQSWPKNRYTISDL